MAHPARRRRRGKTNPKPSARSDRVPRIIRTTGRESARTSLGRGRRGDADGDRRARGQGKCGSARHRA
eukprot:30102-Pelagococcus_subviridis.AAC.9